MIKNLPRNEDGSFARTFLANGKKYIIRSLDEGIGIMRYTKLMKMSSVLGYTATFEKQVQQFQILKKMLDECALGKGSFIDAAVQVHAMQEGVIKGSREKFDMAFYYCTLFIVTENEDLTVWVEADQEEKVKDWNAEGLNERDFLALALSRVAGYLTALQNYSPVQQEPAND